MSGQIDNDSLGHWQIKNLAVALLFYRLNINRVLQYQWLDCDVASTRARAQI
jgi:hypothetical protein